LVPPNTLEKTCCCKNLPQPLFAKEGRIPPFCKWFDRLTILSLPKEGGQEGFRLHCPYNYGLKTEWFKASRLKRDSRRIECGFGDAAEGGGRRKERSD